MVCINEKKYKQKVFLLGDLRRSAGEKDYHIHQFKFFSSKYWLYTTHVTGNMKFLVNNFLYKKIVCFKTKD